MNCYLEFDNLTFSELKKCFQKNCPDVDEHGAEYFMETTYLIAQKEEPGITCLRQKLAVADKIGDDHRSRAVVMVASVNLPTFVL